MKNKLLFVFISFFVFSLPVFAQSKEARKVDEFGFNITCEEAKLKVDTFALELLNNPKSKGYIIFYGGKINPYKNKTPRRNESKVRMQEFMEDYQVSTRLGGNVNLIDGGYRENYIVQFWIVPKEAIPPIPLPTLKPEEIKFRKGKYRRAKQGEGC
jgi:hypothetical protein